MPSGNPSPHQKAEGGVPVVGGQARRAAVVRRRGKLLRPQVGSSGANTTVIGDRRVSRKEAVCEYPRWRSDAGSKAPDKVTYRDHRLFAGMT
eukprot:scaffold1472_cov300-Pinguiococcus_pyrenoidosus.AAC.10